ncbi:hypothetical protein ABBQ32_005783 [Trebouxia sp. C0010 RCD-2024]
MDQAPEAPADTGFRPQGPRTGRRAASTLVSVVSDVDLESSSAAPQAPSGPKPQVPRRRGGWGGVTAVDTAHSELQAPLQMAPPPRTASTAAAAGISRRRAAQAAVQDQETPEPPSQSVAQEDADTFIEIPDLEAAEDLSRQVAAAPAARSVPVMNIAELESADLFRLPVGAKDHEVDLSLLTACLCPADEVSILLQI